MSMFDPQGSPPAFPTSAPMPPGAEPTTSIDRWALVGLTAALFFLMSCVPVLNCLAPLVPLGLGIYTLTQAQNAANPDRARLYGWVATGIGALILLAVLALVALYGATIFALLNDPTLREFSTP